MQYRKVDVRIYDNDKLGEVLDHRLVFVPIEDHICAAGEEAVHAAILDYTSNYADEFSAKKKGART